MCFAYELPYKTVESEALAIASPLELQCTDKLSTETNIQIMVWIQSKPNRQSYEVDPFLTPTNYPRSIESGAPAIATPLELLATPDISAAPATRVSAKRPQRSGANGFFREYPP